MQQPLSTSEITLVDRLNRLYESPSFTEIMESAILVIRHTVLCDQADWYEMDANLQIQRFKIHNPPPGNLSSLKRRLQSLTQIHPFSRAVLSGSEEKVFRLSDYVTIDPNAVRASQILKKEFGVRYVLGGKLVVPGKGIIAVSIKRYDTDFSNDELTAVESVIRHINRHLASITKTDSELPEFVACEAKLRASFGLTSREAEVTYWVATGKQNKDIAVILGISPHTVRTILQKVFEKMLIETRVALAHNVWSICL